MPYRSNPIYWIGSTLPQPPEEVSRDKQSEMAHRAIVKLACNNLGAVLYGPPGTGKSTIMANLARPLVSAPLPLTTSRVRHPWLDRQAIWAQAHELIDDIKAEIDHARRYDCSDWSDAFSASGIARTVPYLFLDDLGVESASDYVREKIEALIDARYRSRGKLLTSFTTNLSIHELLERYSQRTVSRLAEMCEFIEISGADRRLQRILKAVREDDAA